ncbi:MAG TPA: hypothetical protein PLX97_06420 [Gemmatales bacterium]|nr:hypothetical protein [Gemmatales bacterium]
MEHITAAGNTEVPAYLALLREGCRIERRFVGDVEELWIAEKDDLRVTGSGPLEVLGLYYMRKQRGENWKADDLEIDAFMTRFYPQDKP